MASAFVSASPPAETTGRRAVCLLPERAEHSSGLLSAQVLATLIAVYGVFMTPIDWHWALMVWVYAFAWFVINDQLKLTAYRIGDFKGPRCFRYTS
jgi:hypothetical protein